MLRQMTVSDVPRRLWEHYRHERSPEPARSLNLKQFRILVNTVMPQNVKLASLSPAPGLP